MPRAPSAGATAVVVCSGETGSDGNAAPAEYSYP